MSSACLCLPFLSTQPIWTINCHSLGINSGYISDSKWACGLHAQLQELPLMPDYQLVWLNVKQGCGIHLGNLILPGELLNPMLSLPNVIAPQLLELHSNVANFGKVGFFLIWSQLIRQQG